MVSRIVRELEKRTLSVREVLKIRTQSHQQKAVRKRTKVAKGLEIVSSTAEQDASPTLHNYMTNLLTLMIAYSKAGSKLRADAPPSETKIGYSTKVVECPLDVLMRYYYRVQDRTHGLPYHMALNWVRRKDEAERTVWVDRYRNSSDSLGEVFQHTMMTREAMWELPTPEIRKVPAPGGGNGGRRSPGGGKGDGKGPPGGGKGDGKGDRTVRRRKDEQRYCRSVLQGPAREGTTHEAGRCPARRHQIVSLLQQRQLKVQRKGMWIQSPLQRHEQERQGL